MQLDVDVSPPAFSRTSCTLTDFEGTSRGPIALQSWFFPKAK